MMKPNIETFIGCDASFDDASIVLFGAPFDSTTSYRPGARFGSAAIRHESYGLETYSPYLDRDLEDISVFDSGDIELPMGSAE
ncbi:MAG: arginase family protein, partial [Bacteroidaceae bacterium]|nr:arginase family protein [Bacteroidaceae bacterium]